MGAATDTYGYVGPAETTFETSSTGSRSLLDADGSRLAVKNGSTVAWLLFDLHGSVAALCPAGGSALSDAYRYDGWGQTIASWSSGTPAANLWKYRGLLGISPGTTDLLYDMGARDYSPSLGTFTQFDSVQGGAANPATMNRYLYALANPATLIDPDGHMALADECSFCGQVSPSKPKPYVCSSSMCNANYRAAIQKKKEIRRIAYAKDCGFQDIKCHDDPGAVTAGFGMGLLGSGADTLKGIFIDLPKSVIDDTACRIDRQCMLERALASQAASAEFWADPGAALGRGVDDVTSGVGNWWDSIWHASSGFEGARSAGHTTGDVAQLAVPAAGLIRLARGGEALAKTGSLAVEATGATEATTAVSAAAEAGTAIRPLAPFAYAGRSRTLRSELIDLTGINPGKAAQAHHMFPNQFGQRFADLGLDINNPRFAAWWETRGHLANAYQYNQQWAGFLEMRPTFDQVLDFGRQLAGQHGLEIRF